MNFNYFKRYYLGILMFSLLTIFSCNPNKNQTETSQNTLSEVISFKYSTKNKNFVSAHRGGSGIHSFPENCVETFEYLFQKGIRIFEIDVAETKDKQLILMHDN